MTKRRIDVMWEAAPTAEVRQSVERAVQRGAAAQGYLGSMKVRLLPDSRIQVVETSFSSFSDPWRGTFEEPDSARQWLVAGLGAEHVLNV
jgi:hypothetical protein